jgi:membrane-associated phospholipid phosphatase
MRTLTTGLAALLSLLLGMGAAGPALAAPAMPVGKATGTTTVSQSIGSGAVVVEWNRELLSIARTPGAQPATVHATRNFAILHAAIYDAVVSITGDAPPYLVSTVAAAGARPDAGAAVAGHDVLVALYPTFRATINHELDRQLAVIPNGTGKSKGIRVGHSVARQLLVARATDGSSVMPAPFTLEDGPGFFTPTPPGFAPPVFTAWSLVKPFILTSASQFRPAAPPALDSAAYVQAINEVASLGQDSSTTRTADQTVAAKFWAGPIWNTWNEIAESAAIRHRTGLEQTARLFAVLNFAFADGVIAFYNAKYAYQLWRPISAIRAADTDGNPATTADPTWTPLATTPADPSYPGAHSTISAAGAAVLGAFFGGRDQIQVTSGLLPGVVRTFDSYAAVAAEAGLSRIYAGVHTRLDHDAGLVLGSDVAGFVLGHSVMTGSRLSTVGR